jgi:hypothetical protein
MSTAPDNTQDNTLEALPVREHRLGVRGKINLPSALVKSASDHGLDIQATRFKNEYTINSANGKPVTSVLPMLADRVGAIQRSDLNEALSYLHQPLKHLSYKIANTHYEVDIDAALEEENRLRIRPEFLARTSGFSTKIDTNVAYRLQNTKRMIVSDDAKILQDNLYRSIGFISRGSVKEEELHNGGHGDYDDHDDGCEVVAEDLEKAEAKKNSSETSGLLLEGFRFSRKHGQYRLAINENFASGAFEGEAQGALHTALKDTLNKAKPGIQWHKNPAHVYLNAIELERFCDGVYTRTQGSDANFEFAIEDVLREEISAEDFENVDAKTEELKQSDVLARLASLKPDAVAMTPRRITEFSAAIITLQALIDNPDMQGIWKKYNITGRFFKADYNPLAALSVDLERIQRVIDRNAADGKMALVDIEAIAAEFRDTIAGGREVVRVMDKALKNTALALGGADASGLHLSHLDAMLAGASLAPTTLPRAKMDEHAKEIAYYVGRHTGQEGIDVVAGFEDFIDDFGGEIVEFVKKNKILTTALGLSFYFAMNATAGQGGDASVAQIIPSGQEGILGAGGVGFDSNASLTDLLGKAQPSFLPMSIDEQERLYGSQAIEVCHLHLPVKVPYFEHCLFSDQSVKQFQNGYELLKGPLSIVLDAPADGVDLLAQRAQGAPPVYFVDGFKDSLRTTGDVWFVANGYQNLAHAPWAAVAGSMGYKLGVIPAMRRTSGLITPLIDGAYGLAADNKYLLSNIPAVAYGYGEQGLSGAVMATTLASLGAYGAQSVQRRGQKTMESLPYPYAVQEIMPKQFRHGGKASADIINLTKYKRTDSGLLVPHSLKDVAIPSAEPQQKKRPNAEPFKPLPDGLHTQISISIAGQEHNFDLNSETYVEFVRDLTEFQFLLEHAPEKLGVSEEEPEYATEKDKIQAQQREEQLEIIKSKLGIDRSIQSKITDMGYDEYLSRNVAICLDAFEDYARGEMSSEGLESVLDNKIDTILGARIVHLRTSGKNLDTQQERCLSIEGHKTERLFAREAARRDDRAALAQEFFNAGRSISQLKNHPFATPISLGLKAANASVMLGKMGIRNAWSLARDEMAPVVQVGYNSLSPKTKGNLIGGTMLLTALAVKADFDPQLAQTIQDNVPLGGEAITEGLSAYSGAVGHGAGATTATGLFMVYNFGEDHLIIHITMGYACIVGGAGARVAIYPLSKAVQIAEIFAEEIANISKGYLDARKPGRAAKRGLAHLGRLARDVQNYDDNYLPALQVG